MKRVITITLLFILVMSVQVFAQQFDLPEPIFVESSDVPEASFVYLPAAAVFNSSEFADLAYLWAFNPSNAEDVDFALVATFAAAASSDANLGIIPSSIRNNEYFLESVRLKGLAETSYDTGDYDASAIYAAESLRYAQLSDDYVALQLKIREADDTIAQARTSLNWAVSEGLDKDYPSEFAQGQAYYAEATDARSDEDWDGAISSAQKVLALAEEGSAIAQAPLPPPPVQPVAPPPSPVSDDPLALPAQYTVRTWQGEKDCLWNIAGYSWVYGDSHKWRLLYDANKSKMPDPNDPHTIEPGMILDIPSINNETRRGAWRSGVSYPAL
jgi:hypothetical protein